MANPIQTIPPQEARASFVTQGGVETKKVDASKLSAFKNAHASKKAAAMAAMLQTKPPVATPAQQISVNEQALFASLALAGRSGTGRARSVEEEAYAKLFTDDEAFLQADLDSLVASLANGEKCMADLSRDSVEGIALRKYLLATMAKERYGDALDTQEAMMLDDMLAQIEAEYGDTIRSTLTALQVLQTTPALGKIGVQEFIKAYHTLGQHDPSIDEDDVLPSMLALYTSIRKKKRANGSDEELEDYILNMLEGSEKTLRREVGPQAGTVALSRQFLIFRRINHLRLVFMMFKMNQRFVKQLAKAKEPLSNVPEASQLTEACLQALGAEPHTGANMLVSLMSAIQAPSKPAGNASMSLYFKMVLSPRAMQRISPNNTQHRMVRDILYDAMLKDGVLAIRKELHA